jgi:multidrug efflux pump subunit AcrA (membrane-fusion protein)
MRRFLSLIKYKKAALLLVIMLALAGCHKQDARPKKDQAPEAVPVQVERIKVMDLKETLDYAGTIKAQEEVTVFPKVSGKIITKAKQDGEAVEKGESIAFIDRDEVGLRFEHAPVESPIKGIVGRGFVDIGSQVTSQTAIALVVDMDEVTIDFNIPEKYLPQVALGSIAEITVDAYPRDTFKGAISQMSPVIDPLTRTAPCEIRIANPEHKLKSGMFARVKLILKEYKEVPVVLKEAILGKVPDQYVYVVANNRALMRKVQAGARSGEYVRVTEGLQKDELVVIMGQQRLFDGADVAFEVNNK